MSYPPQGSQPPPFDPYGQQQPASPYGQPQQPYGQPQPGAYQQQPAPGGYGAPPPAPGGYPGPTPPPFPGGDPYAQQAGGFPPPPRHRPNKAVRGVLSLVGTVVVIGALAGVGKLLDNSPERSTPGTNLAGPSAEITKGGDLDAEKLRVGDCYKEDQLDTNAGEESVDTLKAIPCTQPHNAQVFAETSMTGTRSASAILKKCQNLELQWGKRFPSAERRVFGATGQGGAIAYLSPDLLGWKSSGLNKITCSVVSDKTLTAKLPTL